ncbi:MAG: DNRLRE domain-containing protein [Chloroflexi bacterium]|nr:DNRLRE domain-containing protein [Chloroflexota bacterium]
MKFRFSKFLFNFLFVFVLLASLLGRATPAQAAESNAALPVERLLNTDGTLDLSTGYSGELDITNFDVSLDPVLGPTFKPLATTISWNALGTGLMSSVITIFISGTDVYAGGYFLDAGYDANADYIAKWDGSAWSALGATPLNSYVTAIAVSGTDVYAGGWFTNAGGDANADYIAKFDGSAWSALGAVPLGNAVHAIGISGTDVYVGGRFLDAGGDANADYIAKWNGSAWSALGSAPLNQQVNAIAVSGTDVYAGGTFFNAGGDVNADFIAKFDGSAWSALGATSLNESVNAIAVSGTDVYAGGTFTDAGGDMNADYIAKFNGSAWSALGSTPLDNFVYAIAISGTDVYAGGSFANAGGDANADFIAKFSGSAWSALGSTPLNNWVYAITISGTDVYAGGDFSNAGGNADADHIARFGIQPIIVTASALASPNPTALTSVDFTVTFSESVMGVDTGDFTLTTSGVSGAAVSGVSGTGSSYTVTVSTGTGNGTIRLDVPASATITDLSSNPLSGLPFTSGETYDIEKTIITTFKSTGAQDGFILESTETSGVGGTMNSAASTLNLGDDAAKRQYRSILSFNTSTLPDNAIVTKVTLKLKRQGVVGGGNPVGMFQGFVVDIKKGMFGTAPLALGDFNATASKTVGPTSPALTAGWYNLNLTPAKTFINKLGTGGGLTQMRLRFKLDDNNNAVANFLKIYSGNAGAVNRPQLVIEYYVP